MVASCLNVHVPTSPISCRPTRPKLKPKPTHSGFGFRFGPVGRYEIGDAGTCTFNQEATMELLFPVQFEFRLLWNLADRLWSTRNGRRFLLDFGQLEIVDFFARFLLRHGFGKNDFAGNSLQKNGIGKKSILEDGFRKKTIGN